jgi:cell filamentation protein
MKRYDASDDPHCFPGSQVLKNKVGLSDQRSLDQFEHIMFLKRADEALPYGNLDYSHYRAIHHHFFQDVYDWAGQTRSVRTAKGGNWFCFPEHIDTAMERLFAELATEDHLVQTASLADFADRASYYLAELNAIHPFRDGNGRCQLTFLSLLLDARGFAMLEGRIDPVGFVEAMIASFHGNRLPLTKSIMQMATPAGK